jgi:DNA polymerase-4
MLLVDRLILHVDMDAFFASIAQLDDPSLRGKPVLTGGDGPRGVVTTASYEARPFGCRSAMPMAVAKRLCPQATVVKVPGARVREMSERMFAVLERFTPLVQPISVDEAFLDVTGSSRLFGDAITIARQIKANIRDATGGLTGSVGVSFNKFLAKLASDMDKPDGLTVIAPDDVDRILPPLPIERLWGVGPATANRLHGMAIRTFGDLRRLSLEQLQRRFGDEAADHYHRLVRGIDNRPVTPDRQAKSIGHEQTFGHDLDDPQAVRDVLLGQVEQVGRRLRRHGLRARGVGLKIRFGDFQTISRSATLDTATDLTDELWRAAATLFDRWVEVAFQPVRLIGVHADRLTDAPEQLDLFTGRDRDKRQRLDATLDQIASRFGKSAIHRGKAGS